MVRTAVVKLSTIKKYKRFDPEFYLGRDDRETTAELAVIDAAIAQKQQKRTAILAEKEFEKIRLQRMAAAGEVKPVKEKNIGKKKGKSITGRRA